MSSKVLFRSYPLKRSHPLKVTSFLLSSVVAVLLTGAIFLSFEGDAREGNAISKDLNADATYASLTSCIDKTGLANEIEITGRAMKKAVNDALGYSLKPTVDRDEKVVYCALNLV